MSDHHEGEKSSGNWQQIMTFELFCDILRVSYPYIRKYFILIWQTTKFKFINIFKHYSYYFFTFTFRSLLWPPQVVVKHECNYSASICTSIYDTTTCCYILTSSSFIITSIYQPMNAHIISHKTLLKHFKTLRHVSILSDHHQGALFSLLSLCYSIHNSIRIC